MKSKTEWLAKKAEKRELQRATNLKRSKTMRADWSKKMTTLNKKPKPPQINVGCSGWFYWHWRGVVYPTDAMPQEWFQLYSKKFNTVELNAPFYSWPTFGTVETWKKQLTKKSFHYTIKVPELITHINNFRKTKTLVDDFDLVATELGALMGCFLYQLPPSFKYTKARLNRIVEQLNPSRRNVVEFRHKSWWNEKVYAAFRQHKIIFCSVSSPKLPNDLIKTTNEIYIRFHGSSKWYRHDYSKTELTEWISKIKKAKPKIVWAYFNNDREGFAVKNAKAFTSALKKIFKNS